MLPLIWAGVVRPTMGVLYQLSYNGDPNFPKNTYPSMYSLWRCTRGQLFIAFSALYYKLFSILPLYIVITINLVELFSAEKAYELKQKWRFEAFFKAFRMTTLVRNW